MHSVNYVAVVVAGVIGFVVGGVWYSPMLFAKSWQAENGFTDEQLKQTMSPARMYGVAVVTSILAAWAMAALLLTPGNGPLSGLKRGAFAGFFWPAMTLAMGYGFERRSTRLWAINAGYIVVQFAVMGAILGWMD
jgi:hypothetical protein